MHGTYRQGRLDDIGRIVLAGVPPFKIDSSRYYYTIKKIKLKKTKTTIMNENKN